MQKELKVEITASIAAIILFLIVFLLANGLERPGQNRPAVKNGVLDLTSWNPKQHGVLKLNGSWDFYLGKLLSSQQMAFTRPDGLVDVPNVWNRYQILNKTELPAFGYATYRLQVKNAPLNQKLALKLSTVSTAYLVSIGNKVIAENGRVGITSSQHIPYYSPKVAVFHPPSKDFDIVVHVSNFTYARGGIWYTISFGLEDQIRAMDATLSRKESILLGALLIMGLYYVSFYLLIRKDISSLLFAVGCFIFIVRMLVTGQRVILDIFPGISFRTMVTLEYLSFIWAQFPFMILVNCLFPRESFRLPVILYAIIAGIYSVLVLCTEIHFYTLFTYPFYLVMVSGIVASWLSVSLAVLRKRKSALLCSVGSFILGAAAIHDILYSSNVITATLGELASSGVFVFLFVQAFIIGQRFSEAFSEVEKLSANLLSLNQLKDEFLANTSHELKTPLHGMISISESLLQGVEGALNERQKHNLNMISISGRRLSNLINDILDYSRLKQDDIQVYPVKLSLDGIVQSLLEMHRYLAGGKPIEIVSESLNGLYVLADENRLVQILHNLLGNAVKYTEQGTIRIYATESDKWIKISIQDSGIGIPFDKQEDIFQSFEQVDTSLTRRYGGSGLGLSITKRLVDLHGGTINVYSVEGKGSTFSFTLPNAGHEETKDGQGTTANPRVQVGQPVWNDPFFLQMENRDVIMVVDDDPINLQTVINLLKLEGYSIFATTDSRKAWEALHTDSFTPVLVILDVMMPQLSGYQVCRMIRERWSGLEMPVLLLTASNQTDDILAGFEAGANDFLTKPFEAEEFRARIRTLASLKTMMTTVREAEMAFLQAQIKPHFLYNALNAIVSFCYTEPERAGDLILDLATYLRRSFDFTRLEALFPIEKERELVNAYVNIEKARFGERLQVEYRFDPDVTGLMIPPLILQPLVENAIRHGVTAKPAGGTVIVSAELGSGECIIQISDNGDGIPEKLLAVLLNQDYQERAERQGVGLKNIHQRLKKLYGHGLEIESRQGLGTTVSLRIPLEG